LLARQRKYGVGLVAVAAIFFATAGSCDQQNSTEDTARNVTEEQQGDIMTGVNQIRRSNQLPVFDFSQEYNTLVDVLTMRAEGTHGTAVLYTINGDILWWCPTQGAPIPSTYQSTPGEQYVDIKGDESRSKFPVDLPEPTGVYTAESNATWVLCLDDNGTPFGKYAEANVDWTSGVVNGLPADKRAQVDEITFDFTTEENIDE
jgi:hypothetical protein